MLTYCDVNAGVLGPLNIEIICIYICKHIKNLIYTFTEGEGSLILLYFYEEFKCRLVSMVRVRVA
jgi:hypothetical protein